MKQRNRIRGKIFTIPAELHIRPTSCITSPIRFAEPMQHYIYNKLIQRYPIKDTARVRVFGNGFPSNSALSGCSERPFIQVQQGNAELIWETAVL